MYEYYCYYSYGYVMKQMRYFDSKRYDVEEWSKKPKAIKPTKFNNTVQRINKPLKIIGRR